VSLNSIDFAVKAEGAVVVEATKDKCPAPSMLPVPVANFSQNLEAQMAPNNSWSIEYDKFYGHQTVNFTQSAPTSSEIPQTFTTPSPSSGNISVSITPANASKTLVSLDREASTTSLTIEYVLVSSSSRLSNVFKCILSINETAFESELTFMEGSRFWCFFQLPNYRFDKSEKEWNGTVTVEIDPER
jgi:hypothetical protein